eukprot:3199321-Amphidinium_carterae.1
MSLKTLVVTPVCAAPVAPDQANQVTHSVFACWCIWIGKQSESSISTKTGGGQAPEHLHAEMYKRILSKEY